MLKITFVIPYEELDHMVGNYLAEQREEKISFETVHLIGVEEARRHSFDCDLVIARGITCAALREFHPELTVVEIPVTGYDVILAVDECRRAYGAKRIALVGAENMIFGAPALDKLFGVELLCFKVEAEQDAERQLREALSQGCQAVVGGLMTWGIARELGIPSTWIRTGPDAIRQAVQEAIRVARIKARERERAEFFKIIMDYTHEGILAVDRQGRITALNRSARKLLKRGQEPDGAPIRQLLPSTGLMKVMERGEEELGALETVNEVMIAANLVPIKVGDEVTGAVATFQNVNRLQEIEGRIRRTIHSKGLAAKYTFFDLLGSSEPIRKTIETARRYAEVDANVLILGETGTGKELFAHSMHEASGRKQGPFVAVNCAALPESLLESELFGYAEGAFTGAARGGKAGLFELAHNGTIFLDEIGEVGMPLQAKLLRVLQEREIRRIGHDRVIPISVRVIVASHHDLKRLAASGAFRRDLLYRLDVLRLNVPALRQRREDIVPLARHFLQSFGWYFGTAVGALSAEVLETLMRHDWPGNVRELMNVCERMAVLADGRAVQASELGLLVDEAGPEAGAPAAGGALPPRGRDFEAILGLVRERRMGRAEAARSLGISRTTLWRKLKTEERPALS